MKKFILSLSLILSVILLVGCGNVTTTTGGSSDTTFQGNTTPSTVTTEATTTTVETTTEPAPVLDGYTVIDVSTITDATYTISEAGSYVLEGTNSNLEIIVNASSQDIVLALYNLNLTYTGENATISIKDAGSFELQVYGNNYVADSSSNTDDSVILVKKTDFIITGTGYLYLTANGLSNDTVESGKALHATKNLILKSSNIVVENANDNAISGKTGITVSGGSITVLSSAGDGLHSKSGAITITSGTFDITCTGDGIDAGLEVNISGGTFNIVTNATFNLWDSSDTENADSARYVKSGSTYKKIADDETNRYTSLYYIDPSAKGIKSDTLITITGGTFNLDTDDDAIHSDGNVEIYAGNFTITTLDDGIHADYLTQLGGSEVTKCNTDFVITIKSCYEGIEGMAVEIYDGVITVNALDDGINSASDEDGANIYMHFGGDSYTVVYADGDGLDSNGSITMYSGTVYVFGPTNSGNGALDYDTNFYLTGGTLVVIGAAGMAQIPDNPSQNTISVTTSTSLTAGSTFYIGNDTYNICINVPKTYSTASIVVSSSSFTTGSTYSAIYGGTTSATFKDNVAYNVTYTGGTTLTSSLTISSVITTYGVNGIGGSTGGGTIGGPGVGGGSGEGGTPSGRPGGR